MLSVLGIAIVVCLLALAGDLVDARAGTADGRIFYVSLTGCAYQNLCNDQVESVSLGGRQVSEVRCTSPGQGCLDRVVVASHRSRRIAVWNENPDVGTVTVLTTGGRVERTVKAGRGAFEDVDWGPDDRRLAVNLNTGAYDDSIALLDFAGRKRVIGKTSGADVAWSRDNVFAWTSPAGNGTFQTLRPKRRRTIKLGGNGVAFSPDGKRLAVVRDDGAFVSDLSGRGGRRVSRRCSGPAADLTWSPSGRYLACVAKGGGIAVIDTVRHASRLIMRNRRVASVTWARR